MAAIWEEAAWNLDIGHLWKPLYSKSREILSYKGLPPNVGNVLEEYNSALIGVFGALSTALRRRDVLQRQLNETRRRLHDIQGWKDQQLQKLETGPSAESGSILDSEHYEQSHQVMAPLIVISTSSEVSRVRLDETNTREQVSDSSSDAEEACTSCNEKRQLEEKLVGPKEESTGLQQGQLANSRTKSEERTPEEFRMAKKFSRLKRKAFSRKQGNEEPVLVYLRHKQAHILRLDPPLSEEKQVDLMIKGMLPCIRKNLGPRHIGDSEVLKEQAAKAEQHKILQDLACKPVKIDQPSRSKVAASATRERSKGDFRSVLLVEKVASMVIDRLAVLSRKTRSYSWRTKRNQSPQSPNSEAKNVKNQAVLTKEKSEPENTRAKVPLADVLCYKCKKRGHYRTSCPKNSKGQGGLEVKEANLSRVIPKTASKTNDGLDACSVARDCSEQANQEDRTSSKKLTSSGQKACSVARDCPEQPNQEDRKSSKQLTSNGLDARSVARDCSEQANQEDRKSSK